MTDQNLTGQTAATQPEPMPAPESNVDPAVNTPPKEKPKREYTVRDRILLAIALLIGFLWDRFVPSDYPLPLAGVFWLCYLVIFYILFWDRVRRNKAAWYVAGLAALLCVWNFLFDFRGEYGILTFPVIPCVMMAHAVFATGGYKLKEVGKIAVDWICGWFVKPFTAVPVFFGAFGSIVGSGKRSTLKRVLAGVGIALLIILTVLLPLLSGADMVFGYYLRQLSLNFSIGSFLFHFILVFGATMFFYSFLWNLGERKTIKFIDAGFKPVQLDRLVCGIVLGAVLAVYALFCAIQFVYLFAGAGLPDGLTYSEYAREGFWQLVVVAGINLALFGIFLQYTAKARWFSAMLAGLLAETAMLLVSAIRRLWLYVDAYGLTWLRLISAWFIVFLAVVLVLCAIRMVKEKLPLIAVCAMILLGWYTLLGYANPDALIVRYNLASAGDRNAWVRENIYELSFMSDNAMIVLLQSDISDVDLTEIASMHFSGDMNLSSWRAVKLAEEHGVRFWTP